MRRIRTRRSRRRLPCWSTPWSHSFALDVIPSPHERCDVKPGGHRERPNKSNHASGFQVEADGIQRSENASVAHRQPRDAKLPADAVEPRVHKRSKRKASSRSAVGGALSMILGAFTLAGFVFGLLGHGFASGIADVFGIPHAALSDSVFDLVRLGADALLQTFDDLYPTRDLGALVSRAYHETWPGIALAESMLLVSYLMWWFSKKRGKRLSLRIPSIARARFVTRVLPIMALAHYFPSSCLLACGYHCSPRSWSRTTCHCMATRQEKPTRCSTS
jgi:hypothetical protein